MVKGISRRVIVVKSPDPKVFEEAIFVLREDFIRQRNAEQVMDEARRAASEYLKKCGAGKKKSRQRILPTVIVGLSGVAASIAWLAARFIGV